MLKPKKKLGSKSSTKKVTTKVKKASSKGHQEPTVKVKKGAKSAPAKKTKKVKRAPAPAMMNKSELIAHYMEVLDWERSDVVAFMNAQEELVTRYLKKQGMFVFPGFLKVVAKKKPPQKMPAIKKGTMVKGFGGAVVKSPGRAAFTKPASVRFSARAMKKLKDAVLGRE